MILQLIYINLLRLFSCNFTLILLLCHLQIKITIKLRDMTEMIENGDNAGHYVSSDYCVMTT